MEFCIFTMQIYYKGGLHMTKYREILRLTALGLSLRDIESSIQVSQKTIIKDRKRAAKLSLAWPLDKSLTDGELDKLMFPKETAQSQKRMPDFDHIRKELLRNGVNKKLLWTEYLEDCRLAGDDPLMYSQFCYHIQQHEQKRRATMHVPRKPGQQIEVDWAGDPAHIIDPYTGEVTSAWIFIGVMTYSQYTFVEAFINEKQRAWNTAHSFSLMNASRSLAILIIRSPYIFGTSVI
jgi:transposase